MQSNSAGSGEAGGAPHANSSSNRMPTPRRGLPRVVEVGIALIGLVVVSPLLLLAAAAVAATSPGGGLFRQQRVGRGGKNFTLYKLRTMHRADTGAESAGSNASRVTPVGRVLRKTKLDEFPELWNIVRGDMSLVGPRPELPSHVDTTNQFWRIVLQARPGLTDPVTLRLRNEEELLKAVEGDPETYYREVLQPYKLRGYADYLQRRTAASDLSVLFKTVVAVVLPHRASPPSGHELAGDRPN